MADGGAFAAVASVLVRVIEGVGIGIIVVGALGSTVLFGVAALRGEAMALAYHDFRQHLGRSILLGLEFLVAADIVNTVVVAPTLENVGILGLIVLIRTFLSFALQVEIEGQWPWQRAAGEPLLTRQTE